MIIFISHLLILSITAVKLSSLTLTEEIEDKINLLGKENSFVYVDLQITPEELDQVDQLKFDNLSTEDSVQYDRFGDLSLLEDELPLFFKKIGTHNDTVIKTVTQIIIRTAQHLVTASNKESAWVCVRASTPTDAYDMPRWHMDGAFYGLNRLPPPQPVFKFAASLKGSSTLLYPLNPEQRDLITSHAYSRLALSQMLDIHHAESPQKGEGVLFVVANNQISALHSEPKIDENRLFFSILVGDKSEIDELYTRWHPTK